MEVNSARCSAIQLDPQTAEGCLVVEGWTGLILSQRPLRPGDDGVTQVYHRGECQCLQKPVACAMGLRWSPYALGVKRADYSRTYPP